MATNLEFIKSVVPTETASLSIDEIFTDKYDVYCIVLRGLQGINTTAARYKFRFIDNSGSVISASEYDYASLDMRAGTSFSERKGTNSADMDVYWVTDGEAGAEGNAILYVYNPNDSSSYTFIQGQSSSYSNETNGQGIKFIGVHKSTETIRGFNMVEFSNNASFALKAGVGAVTVYGVK